MKSNLVVNQDGQIDTDLSIMNLQTNGDDKLRFEFRGNPNHVAEALYNVMHKNDEFAVMILKVTQKYVQSIKDK